jgi:hypothetical protein
LQFAFLSSSLYHFLLLMAPCLLKVQVDVAAHVPRRKFGSYNV